MHTYFLPFITVIIISLASQMADLWINDSRNQHSIMTEHPSLMQAAQWKAEYISQTGHISHCTLENECPNDTIKRYGCQNDYPEGRNQVESLVYGTNDVQIAYESLINSPSHVRHLLGLTDFFSGQQYYGVGHADLIFVFITANCH